jgi:hypothetical protein
MVGEPENQDGEDGIITIREYLYPIQAEWARNILAAVGIPSILPDHHADYLASLTKGVRVQVPQENADEAEAILKECEFEIGVGQTVEHAQYAGEDELPEDTEPLEPPEASVEGLEAPNLGDLVSGFVPRSCPRCEGAGARPAPPPDYAAESLLGAFLKRLAGHGWYRCPKCGHTWESGPHRSTPPDGSPQESPRTAGEGGGSEEDER